MAGKYYVNNYDGTYGYYNDEMDSSSLSAYTEITNFDFKKLYVPIDYLPSEYSNYYSYHSYIQVDAIQTRGERGATMVPRLAQLYIKDKDWNYSSTTQSLDEADNALLDINKPFLPTWGDLLYNPTKYGWKTFKDLNTGDTIYFIPKIPDFDEGAIVTKYEGSEGHAIKINLTTGDIFWDNTGRIYEIYQQLHDDWKEENSFKAIIDDSEAAGVQWKSVNDVKDLWDDAVTARETYYDSLATRAQKMGTYRDSMAKRMTKFKNMMDKVKNKFNNNRAIYTMYFRLKLNGEVIIDTCGYTDDSSSSLITNCLVSFKYEKNGSGMANKFTIEVLFKQNDRSILDIKTLEAKLLRACEIYKSNNTGSDVSNDDKTQMKSIEEVLCNCSFQYGYGDDKDMRSEEYNGLILGYKCKLDNGNLRYTITGVGCLYGAKEIRLSTKPEYLKRSADDDSATSEIRPLEYIQRIFEVEFETEGSENYGLFQLKFADSCYDNNVETGGMYLIGENQSADFTQFQQKNLFQIIEDILAGTVTTEQFKLMTGNNNNHTIQTMKPNQKEVFGYYLDDAQDSEHPNSLGTVVIYLMPTVQGENKSEDMIAHATMNFNWFGPTDWIDENYPDDSNYNHLVISWNPDFDGTVLMGMAASLNMNSDTYQTMDKSGAVIDVKSMGAVRLGALNTDELIFSTVQEYSKWSRSTQYCYSARLTIIGCPCEIPIMGIIRINAIMGTQGRIFENNGNGTVNDGNNHHSSGLYFILNVTDTMNSNGFVTELELKKLQEGYDPLYETATNSASQTYQETAMREHLAAERMYEAQYYMELFEYLYIKYVSGANDPPTEFAKNDLTLEYVNNKNSPNKTMVVSDGSGGYKLDVSLSDEDMSYYEEIQAYVQRLKDEEGINPDKKTTHVWYNDLLRIYITKKNYYNSLES